MERQRKTNQAASRGGQQTRVRRPRVPLLGRNAWIGATMCFAAIAAMGGLHRALDAGAAPNGYPALPAAEAALRGEPSVGLNQAFYARAEARPVSSDV